MYNPPSPRLSIAETTLLWAVCQAKIVPFGHSFNAQVKVFSKRNGSANPACFLEDYEEKRLIKCSTSGLPSGERTRKICSF